MIRAWVFLFWCSLCGDSGFSAFAAKTGRKIPVLDNAENLRVTTRECQIAAGTTSSVRYSRSSRALFHTHWNAWIYALIYFHLFPPVLPFWVNLLPWFCSPGPGSTCWSWSRFHSTTVFQDPSSFTRALTSLGGGFAESNSLALCCGDRFLSVTRG